uniref:trace amine-associated receptor 9-like n=1 Tax=Ciona intestinalis TaxID=7719 RepID=UPI00089DC2E8|nr:trace amine-associated receptor 9-like [Ciona intestinalis]|eukprot:XP_018667225.1 trace amine-associated receptor 9-like [Ciona intestinalis]
MDETTDYYDYDYDYDANSKNDTFENASYVRDDFGINLNNQSMNNMSIVGNSFVPDRLIILETINGSTLGFFITNQTSLLCGFPSFCSYSAYNVCSNTTLAECDECSMIGAGFFIFACVVLGAMILIGNSLVFWYNVRNSSQDKFSIMKASLAIADLFTGIQILCVVFYNISWTLRSTAQELDMKQLAYRDSAEAIAGGVFFMLSITASLYHLLYLSAQRLLAVTKPMTYKMQSVEKVYYGIGVIWFLSVVSATVPAWFSSTFTYTYYHTTFLFYPSVRSYDASSGSSMGPAFGILFLFTVLPYLIMTVLTIASIFSVRKHLKHSAKLSNKNDKVSLRKKEASVLKTVAIMQLGFTITLIPVAVLVIIFYSKLLTCENISTPSVVCFYLSMSNSVVNVLVYSARDKQFRSFVIDVCRCRTSRGRGKLVTPTSSTNTGSSKPQTETKVSAI